MGRTTISRSSPRAVRFTPGRASKPTPHKAEAPSPTARDAFVGAPGTAGGPSGFSGNVATVDAATLTRLKSGTPAEQRLGATIERARVAYAPLLATGAKVTVSCPSGNGGEPVLTLVPADFDASKPFRVQTHFHGWNSSVAEPAGHGAQVTRNLTSAMTRDPQFVFVLPECGNVPVNARPVVPGAQTVAVKTDWSNVQDITAATRQALEAAGITAAPSERVVSAHSGGGRALGYAVQRHPDGSGLKADRLELDDCLYSAPAGTLSARAGLQAWLATPNGAAARQVTYNQGTGGNGEKPDAALLSALGPRYRHVGGFTHDGSVAQTLGRPGPG